MMALHDMERCDVCQGRGTVPVFKTIIQDGPGFKSPTNIIKPVFEQCPKCDGKGMVQK